MILVTEMDRICKQIVSEGKNPGRDGVWSTLLLKIMESGQILWKHHEENR